MLVKMGLMTNIMIFNKAKVFINLLTLFEEKFNVVIVNAL